MLPAFWRHHIAGNLDLPFMSPRLKKFRASASVYFASMANFFTFRPRKVHAEHIKRYAGNPLQYDQQRCLFWFTFNNKTNSQSRDTHCWISGYTDR